MRPSLVRSLRFIPRKALVDEHKLTILPAVAPRTQEAKPPTLHELLLERQAKTGGNWPVNIRIEPLLKKTVFKRVQADIRPRLKRMVLKES